MKSKKKLSKLDEELMHWMHKPNFGRAITKLKLHFENWAVKRLSEEGHGYFKMSQVPFLMNISLDGSTNQEIARKARLTKQAMSKVAKTLEEHGLIYTEKNDQDGRSALIFLTEKGKRFVIQTKKCVEELSQEYIELIGKRNYEIMIDGMFKIIHYHEEKETV